LDDIFSQSKTEVLPSIRGDIKPVKGLGELANIYFSGTMAPGGVIHPLEKFLFLSAGQWYELAPNYRDYAPLKKDDVETLSKQPSKWLIIGPLDTMPCGKEMYALYERDPNRNVYKHTQ